MLFPTSGSTFTIPRRPAHVDPSLRFRKLNLRAALQERCSLMCSWLQARRRGPPFALLRFRDSGQAPVEPKVARGATPRSTGFTPHDLPDADQVSGYPARLSVMLSVRLRMLLMFASHRVLILVGFSRFSHS